MLGSVTVSVDNDGQSDRSSAVSDQVKMSRDDRPLETRASAVGSVTQDAKSAARGRLTKRLLFMGA